MLQRLFSTCMATLLALAPGLAVASDGIAPVVGVHFSSKSVGAEFGYSIHQDPSPGSNYHLYYNLSVEAQRYLTGSFPNPRFSDNKSAMLGHLDLGITSNRNLFVDPLSAYAKIGLVAGAADGGQLGVGLTVGTRYVSVFVTSMSGKNPWNREKRYNNAGISLNLLY